MGSIAPSLNGTPEASADGPTRTRADRPAPGAELPENTQRPDGLCVNAGDWLQRFAWVRRADGDITLKRWDG